MSEVPKTATYTRAYAESNGFLTLLSDGERLTGAYALGPEAGEWLQQATLAIRARVPLDVLRDTIQPFPSFSEIYVAALKALRGRDHGRAPPTSAWTTPEPAYVNHEVSVMRAEVPGRPAAVRTSMPASTRSARRRRSRPPHPISTG